MFPYIHSIYMSIKIKSIKNQPTNQPTNQTIKKNRSQALSRIKGKCVNMGGMVYWDHDLSDDNYMT